MPVPRQGRRGGWTIVQGCTAYVHVNGKPAAWRLMVE